MLHVCCRGDTEALRGLEAGVVDEVDGPRTGREVHRYGEDPDERRADNWEEVYADEGAAKVRELVGTESAELENGG